MATPTVPARVETIRQLFENPALKNQLRSAIPKHLSVDRLLRVAMTAIRTNPKLAECTQKSLLACIMGCAALGLEPEPFLGQAYLVPFRRGEQMECTLIPGYRGYIALARRSGEVQSVSAQVVYERDQFRLQYGLMETLDHIPADGDRGEPKGAYVVFRYKDGSHSFDYMSTEDINKIRDRSPAYQAGIKYKKEDSPWFTDWPEMAKKTVIRRHVKLAPLSVELSKAAALEEMANIGESQVSMLTGEVMDPDVVSEGAADRTPTVDDFVALAKDKIAGDKKLSQALNIYLTKSADAGKVSTDQVMIEAAKDFRPFWEAFKLWLTKHKAESDPKTTSQAKQEAQKGGKEAKQVSQVPQPEKTRILCPDGDGGEKSLGYCREWCPVKEKCEPFQAKDGEGKKFPGDAV